MILTKEYKIYNWLREGQRQNQLKDSSRKSSKTGSRSTSLRLGKLSASNQDKTIEEKVKVAELMVEFIYTKERRNLEYESKILETKENLSRVI